MTNERLLAVFNDLANEAFGYDWFDIRDRLEAWMDANPSKARELIHYAHHLLQEWDHG